MLGFKFQNQHCSEFGVCMKSKNRPILPQPKIVTEEALGRDGLYDFSTANPRGRILYKNREISVDCSFIADSYTDLRQKVRAIALWLSSGEGDLIFDDEPGYVYKATVNNRLDLTQQFKRGFFTIVFNCRPFAYVDRGRAPTVFPVTGNYNSCMMPNEGTYVRPFIRVTGSFNHFKIETHYQALSFNAPGEGTLEIDCEKMTAVYNTANALSLISGSFIEFMPGNNEFYISGDNLSASVLINFKYLYL